MELNRKPTKEEERLINHFINLSKRHISSDWKENITVHPMRDGGMGGLIIMSDKEEGQNRLFGEQISEYSFFDEDGVEVIASLNVDDKGNLFELDIWKTNFSKLLKFPNL